MLLRLIFRVFSFIIQENAACVGNGSPERVEFRNAKEMCSSEGCSSANLAWNCATNHGFARECSEAAAMPRLLLPLLVMGWEGHLEIRQLWTETLESNFGDSEVPCGQA